MTTTDPPDPAPVIQGAAVTLDLIERIRSGDSLAWESLHGRYREALTRLARGRLCGDVRRRLDTEDIVQSTFIAAHESLEGFEHRGPGSFHAWLRQILTNRLMQRQRDHLCDQRDARRHADADALFAEHDSGAVTPDEALQAAEEQLLFAEALTELPERAQEVLIATQMEGESVASVAARMNLSVATIRRARSEAIAALTKKLD